jgi:hypothetical protein
VTAAAPDALAAWCRDRSLSCRTVYFGCSLLIGEAVSVQFGPEPLVTVEWGSGRGDFVNGLPLDALTRLVAGLLGLPPEVPPGTVSYDLTVVGARHVLTQALYDYAGRQRDTAGHEGGSEFRDQWADLADRMRTQAEEAG